MHSPEYSNDVGTRRAGRLVARTCVLPHVKTGPVPSRCHASFEPLGRGWNRGPAVSHGPHELQLNESREQLAGLRDRELGHPA